MGIVATIDMGRKEGAAMPLPRKLGLRLIQSIFSTNNVSDVTGFPRIFNANAIITKTQMVNLGAGI